MNRLIEFDNITETYRMKPFALRLLVMLMLLIVFTRTPDYGRDVVFAADVIAKIFGENLGREGISAVTGDKMPQAMTTQYNCVFQLPGRKTLFANLVKDRADALSVRGGFPRRRGVAWNLVERKMINALSSYYGESTRMSAGDYTWRVIQKDGSSYRVVLEVYTRNRYYLFPFMDTFSLLTTSENISFRLNAERDTSPPYSRLRFSSM